MARQFGTYRSPAVVKRATAVVIPGSRRAETSTAVISHPCLQAEVLVPAAVFAFLFPNVPSVFSVPSEEFICKIVNPDIVHSRNLS